MRSPHRLGTFLLLSCCWLSGCTTSPPPEGLIAKVDEAQLNEAQLRARVIDLVRNYAAEVERCSDRVIDASDDPQIIESALRWKTHSTEACYLAALRFDPLLAFLDLYVLCRQQLTFFESGAGKDRFGELQPQVIAVSKRLVEMSSAIRGEISDSMDSETFNEDVAAWVADYPIESLQFNRVWPTERIGLLAGRQSDDAFAAVQSLDAQMLALMNLMPLYVALIPKQARWQAELLLDNYFDRIELDELVDTLETTATTANELRDEVEAMNASMNKIATFTDQVPDLVERERQELVKLVDHQRTELASAVRRQTDKVDAQIAKPRIAVIDALDRNFDNLADSIDRQRLETIALLQQERQTLRAEVEHAVRYLVIALALMGAALLALGGLIWLLLNRARSQA